MQCDGARLENTELMKAIPTGQAEKHYGMLPQALKDLYHEQNPGVSPKRWLPDHHIHAQNATTQGTATPRAPAEHTIKF